MAGPGPYREELIIGAKQIATIYVCTHSHHWVVFGPHVFDCRRQPIAVVFRRVRWWGSMARKPDVFYQQALCGCGARAKSRKPLNKTKAETAYATYLIGGYAAAAQVLDIPAQHQPSAYGFDMNELPVDFPAAYDNVGLR